jgi:preprotein translocase subunit SecG
METIETLVLVFHVLAALAVIGLVLIQHGKGADAGAGFGGGASSTVFGSGGAGNFLQRTTTGIAIAFFITSFGLAYYAKEKSQAASGIGIPVVVEAAVAPVQEDAEGELPAFESLDQDSEIPEG